MNPPVQPASEADAAVRAELESRLVIVVGMGVHSGSEQTRAKIQAKGVHGGLPLFEVHVPSFLTVAQPNFIYRQGAAAGGEVGRGAPGTPRAVPTRRFYLAFDHNDALYEKESFRQHVEAEFGTMLAAEVRRWFMAVAGSCLASVLQRPLSQDAKRWHPPGYKPGVTVDGSSLVATLHWVHCNYAGKPSWAHSDAIMAGFKVR